MKFAWIVPGLFLLGCDNSGLGGPSDLAPACPEPPDLAPAPAQCAAAKGLSGDILGGICLDMDKIDTQGLMTRGFKLTDWAGHCAGWEVAANKLQPKNINTAAGFVDCGFLPPTIQVDAKYSRVTLALVHQANIQNVSQQARIEYFVYSPDLLRVWVNPAVELDQQTIVTIDRAKLIGLTGAYAQVLLHVLANKDSPTPTWTISSIALLGNP